MVCSPTLMVIATRANGAAISYGVQEPLHGQTEIGTR